MTDTQSYYYDIEVVETTERRAKVRVLVPANYKQDHVRMLAHVHAEATGAYSQPVTTVGVGNLTRAAYPVTITEAK